jgi:hypothetical protein
MRPFFITGLAGISAMVSYIDYQVGCIVDEFKKQGIYKN